MVGQAVQDGGRESNMNEKERVTALALERMTKGELQAVVKGLSDVVLLRVLEAVSGRLSARARLYQVCQDRAAEEAHAKAQGEVAGLEYATEAIPTVKERRARMEGE